jgi:hypothetical protein
MAPRPKVPRGLSMANKEKEQEIIIVSKILVDIDLLDLGSRTLNNQNRDNTTLDNTQAKQLTIEQY